MSSASNGLERLAHRFPSRLVDSVAEHEPGKRLVAFKNVTVNEDFFQGHFPHRPVMPAVLMIEALTQAATLLLPDRPRVRLRGVDDAKFRRQVVPGDQLKLVVTRGASRGPITKVGAVAEVAGQPVMEATLLLAAEDEASWDSAIDPAARIEPGAVIGEGTTVGPFAVVGRNVRIGRNCTIGASAVIDGHTSIGDGTEVFPYASIGLAPQDLKYKGEKTRLEIGAGNIFREFVTIHRGTAGGGGVTRIGDRNLFMNYVHVAHDCHVGHHTIFGPHATLGGGVTSIGDRNLFMNYVHVAHDCHVGNHTIFGPHATLGGHVTIADFVNVSAGSAVHQFCRVGAYAFIGGYSVITKDALPYGRTVGSRPARIYGLNLIGLKRRGFTDDTLRKLRHAYRYLTQSRLNASQALARIEADASLACPEVTNLVDFIRTAQRGVILRRSSKKADDGEE